MSSEYSDLFDDESSDEITYDFSHDASVQRYGRGGHVMPTETDSSSLRRDADKLRGVDDERAALLEKAADEYDEMNREPVQFECSVCSLGHSHSSTKHDIRDAFDVRQAFADAMKFEPQCHCGVNELAMLVDFVEHIPRQMFEDTANEDVGERTVERIRSAADSAPIANETRQRIEKLRGKFEDEFVSPDVYSDEEILDTIEMVDETHGYSPMAKFNSVERENFVEMVYMELDTLPDIEVDRDRISELVSEYLDDSGSSPIGGTGYRGP